VTVSIYLQALDARHEVPPANLLPAMYRRAIPYLYSDAEIDALMQAARGLRPALRAATCETLIGLCRSPGCASQRHAGLAAAMWNPPRGG
jgi:integrase/recombinase XerD